MRRPVLALLAALPLLLGAGGTTPRSHNVLLSRSRTEPAVAIDPVDPSLVVAGGNTNYIPGPDGTSSVPYFTSHDGGKSFSVGALPMPSPYTTGADASVAIARDGTVFYDYLAESSSYCSGGPAAILLFHSIDRGLSFRAPVVVDSNSADDRPTLAVENIPGRYSHIFVAWTRSYPDHSEIWVTRSVDGGATFSAATMLYSSSRANVGALPVVGPRRHVYVFWQNRSNVPDAAIGSAQVLLAASADDGVHFAPVRGAGASFLNLPQLAQPGSLRDLTTLAAAAGPSGILYVSYSVVRDRHPDGSVDADIWLTRSLDHGTTWSLPQRLNDVRRGDRFMPALSVLGDGTLGVAFYDRRAGPGELDVYAVRASFTHGFAATGNVRVNRAPSPVANVSFFKEANSCFPSGRFFGDYMGTAAGGTTLGVAWADSQLQQKNETDLWFARVRLPALPHRQSSLLLHSPSRRPLLERAWGKLKAGSRLLLSPFAALARAMHLGGLSSGQLLLLCLLFLLPALAIATALVSLRSSRR